MNRPIGFSYVCSNCNYISFFGTAYYNINPSYPWRCWRCGYKLDYHTFMFGVNIKDLIEEGFDMKIAGKECHWVKIENPPDELELLSECTIQAFNCPYCQAQHQQFVELSKDTFKMGILCPSCSALYYGEWTEINTKEKLNDLPKEI